MKGAALALIRVAVANAPERDRIWIEDIYQNIFCGASSGNAAGCGWAGGGVEAAVFAAVGRRTG